MVLAVAEPCVRSHQVGATETALCCCPLSNLHYSPHFSFVWLQHRRRRTRARGAQRESALRRVQTLQLRPQRGLGLARTRGQIDPFFPVVPRHEQQRKRARRDRAGTGAAASTDGRYVSGDCPAGGGFRRSGVQWSFLCAVTPVLYSASFAM
jgi:hypothetical protein